MKKLMFVCALLADGCLDPEPWGACDLTVVGDSRFEGQVAQAVARWDAALYDRCGYPVFRIVETGGNPVREVDITEWLRDDYGNDVLGFFDGDEVAIRSQLQHSGLNVTLHELGHALGLHHISAEVDRDSLMFPVSISVHTQPSAGDVERAAAVLGCI